jgi:hypothetical protein
VFVVLATVVGIVRPGAERDEPAPDAALTGLTRVQPVQITVPPPPPVVVPETASAAPSPPTSAPPATTATAAQPAKPAEPSRATPRSRSTKPPAADAAGSSGKPGVRPVSRKCRGSADGPQAGDIICFSGTLDAPLAIEVGGTPGNPVVYSGDGRTRVPGIRSTADHVVIQGFVSDGADSTGIWASGTGVTIQDNTVTRVRHTDEDLDAIRFFGNGSRVLHNFVHDLEGSTIGGSHVDCIQTYATSRPGSSDVVIQGNRCEGIRAQCLMAEGPNDEGGSGEGVSRRWLFDGNYCDAHAAAQSVALEDIQDVTISNNEMVGKATKAFALGRNSTGTVVQDNRIGPGYGRAVGFDHASAQDGYRGPPAR